MAVKEFELSFRNHIALFFNQINKVFFKISDWNSFASQIVKREFVYFHPTEKIDLRGLVFNIQIVTQFLVINTPSEGFLATVK